MATVNINEQLYYACLDGKLEEVERLLGEGADINWIGEGDKTPLSIAAYCNHPKVVQLLLKHGANINTTDKNNRAPVTWAAAFKDHYSVVEILINNGADLEIPSLRTGSTTLIVASHAGNIDIIKLLVSNGAKWNVKDREGMFPIDVARREGHTEVVEYLSSLDSHESQLKRALSEGIVIKLELSRLSIHGPPGSGKTCLQHLLLNEDVPTTRQSTGIVTPAVRASANRVFESNKTSIKRVSEEEFLKRLINKLPDALESQPAIPPATPEPHSSGSSSSNSSNTYGSSSSKRPSFLKRLFTRNSSSLSEGGASPVPTSAAPSDVSISSSSSLSFRSIRYEIISRSSSSSGSSDEQHLVRLFYCIDSGGQSAFQDVAPAFLKRNSLNIVTLKLNEKLDEHYDAEFFYNGRLFPLNKSHFTNRQVITSFARSLSSLSICNHPLLSSASKCHPGLLVIGTFEDEMGKCTETLKEKNESLKRDLEQYKEICIKTPQKDIIHPVNTLIDQGREEVSARLNGIINDLCPKCTIDVPWKWYIFQLTICKEAEIKSRPILSIHECREICRDLEMAESLEASLSFFDNLGILFFFPSVLPDVVFVNPQPLIKMTSDLVSSTFVDNLEDLHYKVYRGHEKLKKEGLFTVELVDELGSQYFVPDIFTSDDYIKLLLKLSIIALVPSHVHQVHYFIPCVLEWKDIPYNEVARHCVNNTIHPLILTWNNQPIPFGLFTGLINFLLSYPSADSKSSLHFKLNDDDKIVQYRNVINLIYTEGGGWLMLVDRICSIEIFFSGEPVACPQILDTICEGIQKILSDYCYDLESIGLRALQKGFYDSSCRHNHICVHADGIIASNDAVKVTCGPKVILLKSNEYLCWFKVIDDIEVIPPDIPRSFEDVDDSQFNYESDNDFHQVIKSVQSVKKWHDLGLALHLKDYRLKGINEQKKGDIDECRREMIAEWMKNHWASWRQLCIGLCDKLVEESSLAEHIRREHLIENNERAPDDLHVPAVIQYSQAEMVVGEESSLDEHLIENNQRDPDDIRVAPMKYSPAEMVVGDDDTENATISRTSNICQTPYTDRNEHNDYCII